jgi:hypothetical protein
LRFWAPAAFSLRFFAFSLVFELLVFFVDRLCSGLALLEAPFFF